MSLPAGASGPENGATARASAGDSVLIVDDNPTIRRLLQVVLEAAGLEVRVARDGAGALAQVRSAHPSLILMDVQLPGMDGLELTRRLKADPATEHIVVVAVTAYAMASDEQRARQAGCDGYLSKPIDVNVLPGIVSSYLEPMKSNGSR